MAERGGDATVFVLVHSPIVGPDTWEPVAATLRARGLRVVVPELHDDGRSPFWRQHVDAVVSAVQADATDGQPIVIAAHSGAGQLTGHLVAQLAATRPVTGCLLVDAGLPTDGGSRLDQLTREEPAMAADLVAMFEAGRRFPEWTDESLADLVPSDTARRRLVVGIRPQPPEYWREPVPVVGRDLEIPFGVLLLSDGYEATAEAAGEHGWPVRRLDGNNHFLLVANPELVADELVALSVEVASTPRLGHDAAMVVMIVPRPAWEAAVDTGVFEGAAIDLVDGFIHLSTPSQVRETLALHFADEDDLLLIVVDPSRLGDALRYEPSRDGELFPHLYGKLQLDTVVEVVPLPLDDDGQPRVPASLSRFA